MTPRGVWIENAVTTGSATSLRPIQPILSRPVTARDPSAARDDGTLTWRARRTRCIFMPNASRPQEVMMADAPDTVIDPVCGMYVDPAHAAASRDLDGRSYFFCSQRCAQKFDADAPAYLAAARGDDWRTWPTDELT